MAGNKDYFFELPLHVLQDPSMLRLMKAHGMEGVGLYVGICCALAIAYNENRPLDTEGLEALAYSWHIDGGHLLDVCDDMAYFGLISAELWNEDKRIGIDMVAERVLYRRKKAEAGASGGRARALNAGQNLHDEQPSA